MEERIKSKEIYVKQTKLHAHQDELQIILVLKGTIQLHKMERVVELHESEFAFVNAKIPHYIESEGAYVLSILVDLVKFKKIFERIKYMEFITLEELSHIEQPLKERLDGTVIDFLVKNHMYQDKNYYIAEKQFNEEQLLFMLISNYQLISHNRDYEQYYTNDLIDRYYMIVEYIMEHIDEKIKASDVLNVVYMNQTYFSQFMKKISGIGFKEFVNYRKLALIMNRMMESDEPLADIAYEVGITDMKSFYNLFKKYHKKSPATWKKEMSELEDVYQEVEDESVLLEYIDLHNLNRSKENTFEKLNKYLLICQANNISLAGMEVEIDPYLDCSPEDLPYYRPYKYFSSCVMLLHQMKVKLKLDFQYKNLHLEGERNLFINTLRACTFNVGLVQMKKWQIVFRVDTLSDFEDAKKYKELILKNFPGMVVNVTLDIFTKK